MEKIITESFHKTMYDEFGVIVLKNILPKQLVEKWQEAWKTFYENSLSNGRKINDANPVVVHEELPEILAHIYRNDILIDVAKQIHGEDLALYNHRFVVKDKHSLDSVFLHQDSCYHLGNLNKCSFFIPLSEANEANGGLSFYIGSHKCGYLGDAGEINPEAFPFQFERVTPSLNAGDVIIMNSHTWHESGPNIAKIDRIIIDIHYQPADDPTGKELLSGEWKTKLFFSKDDPTMYFKNSRILKIKNMKNEK